MSNGSLVQEWMVAHAPHETESMLLALMISLVWQESEQIIHEGNLQ